MAFNVPLRKCSLTYGYVLNGMINLGVRCTLGLINYPFLVSTHEKVLRRVITKQVVSVPVVIFCCSTCSNPLSISTALLVFHSGGFLSVLTSGC